MSVSSLFEPPTCENPSQVHNFRKIMSEIIYFDKKMFSFSFTMKLQKVNDQPITRILTQKYS